MTKPSIVAKLVVSHLVAALCAYTAHRGNLKLAELLGTAAGKRLAPVINPLFTSASPSRRSLGVALLVGAVVPLAGGAGMFGAVTTILTYVSVEKHLSEVLADEDWSKLDEIAEPLFEKVQRRKDLFTIQSSVFGTVPAILQAMGFNAIHVYEGTTDGDDEQAASVH